MNLRLHTADVKPVQAMLQRSEATLRNPEPLLKAWGVEVMKIIATNFREGGNPRWEPLKPSTVATRRQRGKGGGAQPLRNISMSGGLEGSFSFRTSQRQLDVFSNKPYHRFQELGTRGPYEIRAKHGKALAIPTGAFTLSGLGRSAPTGRGSFIFNPVAGQKIPKRLRSRIGKAVAPYKSVEFRTKVIHPGLPPRPVFPTKAQVIPVLERSTTAFLALRAG